MKNNHQEEQAESTFLLNELPFTHPAESITIGLASKPTDGAVRISYPDLPDHARTYFPGSNKSNPFLYIQFAGVGDANVQVSIELKEHPAVTQKYYTWLLRQYFINQKIIVRTNFVKDLEVWIPYKESHQLFPLARYHLKVNISQQNPDPTLRVAFEGFSYILGRNLLELGEAHPEAVEAITRVIYQRRIYAFNKLPNEGLSDRAAVYPVLNRQLAKAARITFPKRIDLKKHSTSLTMIQLFAQKYLLTDKLAKSIPLSANWLPILKKDAARLAETKRSFVFGNRQIGEDIRMGLLQYGPYRPLRQKQIRVFFIYHRDDAGIREQVVNYLSNTSGNTSLAKFIKIPVYFDRDIDIVFSNKTKPQNEIFSAIDQLSLHPEEGYLGLYLSPYDKMVTDAGKHLIYFRVKEALLQRNIASQTIDRDKMQNAGTAFRYWIPNLAMAIIAKLGGVPWVLKKHENNDLVVGFGMYATRKYNMHIVGSSVCFSNDGRFEEFDFFPEDRSYRIAAALEKALTKYVTSHKTIDRMVIHYYKDMSKKDFKPILEMAHHFQPGIPVIVVHINSTKTGYRIVKDTKSVHGLPLNGSFFHLGNHNYLLYHNRCESREETPGYLPLPIQLSIKSSNPELLKDSDYVKGLMEQIYAFSNIYWRGITQPPTPVTVSYPKMLAKDAVWFKRQSLPGTAQGIPWFL